MSAEARRGLHALYLLIAILALGVGVSGMCRALGEVGRPFGGFVWGWDPSAYSPIAAVETPWHWPGPQHGLRGNDRILAVDGQDPLRFHTAYAAKEIGEEIAYLITRGDRQFTVRVPLGRFTTEKFLEVYGLIFLVGLSCLVAGYALVRGAGDQPTVLVAFTLLALAGIPLYHGYEGGISRFYYNFPALVLLFIPSYPLAGALLTHFFLVFPYPLTVLEHHRRLAYLPYVVAIALILLSALATRIGGLWNTLAFRLFLLSITLGLLLSTARSLWSFASTALSTSLRPGPEGRGRVGGLGIALAVGLLIVLGAGVVPFLSGGTSILFTELLTPLAILYPLALAYAAKNAELIGRLRHEIAMQEQLEAEARELRGIRERTLHEVADALHDTVIADVRGLQLWLAGMRRRHDRREDSEGASLDSGELAFLEETLENVYRDARRIMEGAKPVDFTREGLLDPLERSLAHFRQANPGLEVHLETGPYDEDYPAAVKEEVYWIVQTALANSRDHAGARYITVALSKGKDRLCVSVRDDGTGFDVDQVLEASEAGERRRLGLRNMRMRAARIGAELAIESGPQGTEVRLEVPLDR